MTASLHLASANACLKGQIVIIFTLIGVHGVLSSAVLGAHRALGAKAARQINKRAPFECGFSAKMPARAPVSLQFFLIALFFLIFDIELILLYPALSDLNAITVWKLRGLMLFLLIVTARTLIEWSQRILE